VVNSTSGPTAGVSLPFTVDCDGALVVTQQVLYKRANSYNVTVRVDNVGLGDTKSAYCKFPVTIKPVPQPPTIANPTLYMYDLAANGTKVGNIGLINNNNIEGSSDIEVSSSQFVSTDTPDAFAIDNQGNITVKLAVLDATKKSVYTYTVNASD